MPCTPRTTRSARARGWRIEDALALVKALEAEPGDLAAALARYEADPAARSWRSWWPPRDGRRPGTSAFPSTCGSRRSIWP